MAVTAASERKTGTPAVFFDKDGTLIMDVPHNVDVERIRIYPEVPEVLAALAASGYRLFVVSNQPGIAQGYFDVGALDDVAVAVHRLFEKSGTRLAGFYYCPHHPQGVVSEYARDCGCRKPRPGLLERAAREHDIDLKRSWMIGDILNDVEAGNRAGCRTILVDRGNETEWVTGEFRQPDAVASDLRDALRHIQRHCESQLWATGP